MSKTISDSEGNEVEVFTADELEAQTQQAIEDFKKENPDQSDKIAELESTVQSTKEALEKANKDLEAASGKDQNFAALRKAKEDAERKAAEATSALDVKLEEAKTEILSSVNQDHLETELARVSAGDEELLAKIKESYGVLNLPIGTKSEITSRVEAAVRLASPENANALTSAVVGSGRATAPRGVGGSKPTLDQDAKDLGAKLGITDKDIDKYDK